MGRSMSAGKVIEDAAGASEIGEKFFFGAEFWRMGNQAAAGTSRGMFHVEHFVIEDVLDGDLRDSRMVHSAIQQDLIGPGVVTAELAAPASYAPSDIGAP